MKRGEVVIDWVNERAFIVGKIQYERLKPYRAYGKHDSLEVMVSDCDRTLANPDFDRILTEGELEDCLAIAQAICKDGKDLELLSLLSESQKRQIAKKMPPETMKRLREVKGG
jgi:hypothetical protein